MGERRWTTTAATMIGLGGLALGTAGGCVAGCTFGVVTSPSGTKTTVTTTVRAAPIPTSPTATPTPNGPQTTIPVEGTYAVGVDIVPGTYRTAGPVKAGRSCYYKRLASFDSDDIIDIEGSSGPQVVTIAASDVAFNTSGCQAWTLA